MKQMIKKNIRKWFYLVCVFILLFSVLKLYNETYLTKLYGQSYVVKNSTQMYWYPNNKAENISFYLFKENDNDILYCKYENENKDFYLCAWKFSLFREPLFGWIKSRDLKIK